MTSEGILARGKANYESGKLLDNSETLAYAATLKDEKPIEKPKEEKKDAKSKSR